MDRARDPSVVRWGPAVVALVAWVAYAWLAPAGPSWLDSAELGVAAVELGVPHPTGFPLWIPLAKLASWIPVGELAWRIHLVSAATGALAVLWTSRLVIAVARPVDDPSPGALVAAGWGGVAAGALLASSLLFARHAVVTEVYVPTVAALAAAVLLIERVAAGAPAPVGLALAVVCGLGLGLHVTFVFVGPVVVALLAVRLRRGARFPLAAPTLVVVLAGALYLGLGARSAGGGAPRTDWGHPSSAASLWDHVRGASIRASFDDEMLAVRPAAFAGLAARHGGELLDALGPVAVVAAALGLVVLWDGRRTRWVAAAVSCVAAFDLLYALLLNPMGLRDGQLGAPVTWAATVAAGIAVAALARRVGRLAAVAGAAVVVLLALPAALLSGQVLAQERTGDGARRWAEAALAQPTRAVVVASSDSLSAAGRFLQLAEGARPDLAVLLEADFDDPRTLRAELVAADVVDLVAELDRGGAGGLLAALGTTPRPLAWELGGSLATPAQRAVRAGAPASVLLPSGAAAAAGDLEAAAARAVALLSGDAGDDPVARRTLAWALTAYARLAVSRGRLDLADALLDGALVVRPGDPGALVNRAAVASRRGDLAAADRLAMQAVDSDPLRPSAREAAGRYALAVGDAARARAQLERALALAAPTASALALLAVLDLNEGQRERGLRRLREALRLDPSNRDARALAVQLEQARPR